MTEPSDQPKITRLPRRGPKPGQSTESYLRGRANGDRQWDRIKDRNIGRLVQRPRNRPPSP